MPKTDLKLRPIHYASVSGGKDSLYMLGLILANLEKYPLDLVVHYELEIDWDWSKKVVDEIEKMCSYAGIKMLRLKPETSWDDLCDKYGFPTRLARWCNNVYKLSAETELKKWIASQNCRPLAYIGFCADEIKRFKYNIGDWENQDVCYPLAEEEIMEYTVLRWARKQPLLKQWYTLFNRQGCKLCPMISRLELAYLYKYENKTYQRYMIRAKEKEEKFGVSVWEKYTVEQIDKLIKTKWLHILETREMYVQLDLFDDYDLSSGEADGKSGLVLPPTSGVWGEIISNP